MREGENETEGRRVCDEWRGVCTVCLRIRMIKQNRVRRKEGIWR